MNPSPDAILPRLLPEKMLVRCLDADVPVSARSHKALCESAEDVMQFQKSVKGFSVLQ